MKNENDINIDILKHLENLSNDVNKTIAPKAKGVFRRYPVTFGLLILLGATALHEGLKETLRSWGLLEINPIYLIIAGLVILTITGTLYKKLEK